MPFLHDHAGRSSCMLSGRRFDWSRKLIRSPIIYPNPTMNSEVTLMNHLTSIDLAKLRQHELRADAARARLAAEAGRGRRRRLGDRRDRIGHRWRRRPAIAAVTGTGTGTAAPAVTARSRSPRFDGLATRLAAEGSAAVRDELRQFVADAAARGAAPTLLSILVDDDQPDVVRQRAFGRVVVDLTDQERGSARKRSGTPNAA
jgi:hypothetical protein